jgi:shikimate kinase
MPRNLVLIGMPSAGKSTLGVLAAKALGMDFLDTDILLQTLQGERLQALMARHGRERFLQLEAQAILSLSPEHTVIATGGSVVYDAAAMRHLKQVGRVVYLEVPFEEIAHRLADTATRGVVMRRDSPCSPCIRSGRRCMKGMRTRCCGFRPEWTCGPQPRGWWRRHADNRTGSGL